MKRSSQAPRLLCLLLTCLLVISGSCHRVAGAPSVPAFGQVDVIGEQGPALVLMPCLGCDGSAWREFMERNRHRYRMFAVTWPGMGATQAPVLDMTAHPTPLFNHLDSALKVLIQQRELDRPILVAHSAAAVHAIHFAAQYPELISGVVNVDGVITNWDWFQFSPERRDSAALVEMAAVRASYGSDSTWRAMNVAAAAAIRDPARRAFYRDMWLRPAKETVLRYWEEWLRVDAGAVLRDIVDVPVLSLYVPGTDSQDPQHILERFRRNAAGPNFTTSFVPGASHSIWESHPERFDSLLAEFTNRVGRSTGNQ